MTPLSGRRLPIQATAQNARIALQAGIGDNPRRKMQNTVAHSRAILYFLLAGRPPYCEATPLKTVLKVVSDDPVLPVSKFRKDVPAKLEQIYMTCLDKNPTQRYATSRAVNAY
jgi:hypothetical protein